MPQSALAVGERHSAQIVAVALHEIERPEHKAVLGALVHCSMQGLEPVHVHELGIDDRRAAWQ